MIFDVPFWSIFGSTIRTNNDVEGNALFLPLLLSIISFHSLDVPEIKSKKLKKADKVEPTFILNFNKIYEVYLEYFRKFKKCVTN